MNEIEEDKLLLAQDILRLTKSFMDKYKNDLDAITISVTTDLSTMRMDDVKGKCRAGKEYSCDIDLYSIQDEEDYDE